MDIIEELKKETISSNYFNLLGQLTDYSGRAFKIDGVLEMTVAKLKEAYPSLSDKECRAICHPFLMTGDSYRIRDFIIVGDTLFGFINDEYNNCLYSDYVRICKIEAERKFYRNIISDDFIYNFEESQYKNGKVNHRNNTGLSPEDEIEYTRFLSHAFNLFFKNQGIKINVLSNDQQIQNGETLLFVIKDRNFICQDYSIFVDCNFIHLARSFAKKQEYSMNLLLFKGKELEMTATLSQTFEKYGDCKVELKRTELPYFSLDQGYQTTTTNKSKETVFSYSQFSKKGTKGKKNSITVTNRKFPYNAILIDSDKKESLVKELPAITNLPLIMIPSFHLQSEMLEFLHEQIKNYQSDNQSPFVISGNPSFITISNLLNLDTCFINSGLNDTESYLTTYEVPNLEKVKQIRLKKV